MDTEAKFDEAFTTTSTSSPVFCVMQVKGKKKKKKSQLGEADEL